MALTDCQNALIIVAVILYVVVSVSLVFIGRLKALSADVRLHESEISELKREIQRLQAEEHAIPPMARPVIVIEEIADV